MLRVETIAATTPPPSTSRSPKNQATPPDKPATSICLTQSFRSVKSFIQRFNIVDEFTLEFSRSMEKWVGAR